MTTELRSSSSSSTSKYAHRGFELYRRQKDSEINFRCHSTRLELSLGEEVTGLRTALAASEREKRMLTALLRLVFLPRGRSRSIRNSPALDCSDSRGWNQEGDGDSDYSDN
jgi:hypothetical protein